MQVTLPESDDPITARYVNDVGATNPCSGHEPCGLHSSQHSSAVSNILRCHPQFLHPVKSSACSKAPCVRVSGFVTSRNFKSWLPTPFSSCLRLRLPPPLRTCAAWWANTIQTRYPITWAISSTGVLRHGLYVRHFAKKILRGARASAMHTSQMQPLSIVSFSIMACKHDVCTILRLFAKI